MLRFLVLAAASLAIGNITSLVTHRSAFINQSYGSLVLASPTRISSYVNFALEDEWYTVPNNEDGQMELMSRQQIIDHISLAPRFNYAAATRYNLHTRTNPEGVRIFLDDDEGLLEAGFNWTHPVRFTIHGWKGDNSSLVNAVQQFLVAGEFNHIVVDWSVAASSHYLDARNRVPEVAKEVGLMASFLVQMGSNWSQIYTIGHSLGGHLAAQVGQYLEEGEIEACVCLDPAGPLFSDTKEDDRASPDDCKYVEVLHTNGGTLGFARPIGNSDFYPNGGKKQPGCGMDLLGGCSHARAPELYQESLVTGAPGFVGHQCNGTADDAAKGRCELTGLSGRMLGDPVNFQAEGYYYLTTSDSSPYVLPLED